MDAHIWHKVWVRTMGTRSLYDGLEIVYFMPATRGSAPALCVFHQVTVYILTLSLCLPRDLHSETCSAIINSRPVIFQFFRPSCSLSVSGEPHRCEYWLFYV